MISISARRVLVVTALAAIASALHVWYGNRHGFFDLRIYWEAVGAWADGKDLYAYARPDASQGTLGFTYPPFAALVLRPLAALPFWAAAALSCVVSGTALVLVTYWLVAPVADRLGQPRWYALGVALPLVTWLEPIRETISFGQINLLLTLLVVADLLVAVPRRSRLAGVGIGLAAAIKLTPAIFIVYLLVTRRWRAGLTAIAAAAAATLLAAAADWRASWQFWTETMWGAQRIGHVERIPNQSLLGALARVAEPAPPSGLLWAALAAAVLGYGLWRARRAAPVRTANGALVGDEVAGLTLVALTGSLVSPVTWSHHIFWFVPAIVLLLGAATGSVPDLTRARRYALAALAGVVYVTVSYSVIAWYDWSVLSQRRWGHGVSGFLIDNWYVLLMLVLLVAVPIRRPSQSGPVSAPPAAAPASTTHT